MAITDYLKGSGTIYDPYIIHNRAAATQYWKTDVKSTCYAEMVADIDMAGVTINGTYRSNSYGNLNGNGYCISNLNWNNEVGSPARLDGVYRNIKFLNWTGYNGAAVSFYKKAENIEIVNTTGVIVQFEYRKEANIKNILLNGYIRMYEYYSTPVAGAYNIGGTFVGATDLSSNSFIYDPALYPDLLDADWVKDGASIPRLRHKPTSALTQVYAVKGITKVGGQAKSRRCRSHSPIDFNEIANVISASDGSYLLSCGYYADQVFVTHVDDYGSKLTVSKAYSLGDYVHPAIPNGYRYKCTTAGTTAASLPEEPWPTSSNLVSGTAIFTPEPVYKAETFLVVPKLYNLLTGQPV